MIEGTMKSLLWVNQGLGSREDGRSIVKVEEEEVDKFLAALEAGGV